MLPNLIVIGAMKSATSSLHHYLNLHPEIFMSDEKELDFFVEEANWHKGLEWYEAQFPHETPVRGESSPSYAFYPRNKGVPKRMHGIIPDAKLIYIVRDPVERLISHYVHFVHRGYEKRPFAEAVLDPSRPYLSCSSYDLQLRQFLQYYQLPNVLIVCNEDLLRRRREVMQKIFRFLNVDDTFESDEFAQVKHVSSDMRHFNSTAKLVVRAAALLKYVVPLSLEQRKAWKDRIQSPFAPLIRRPDPTPEVRNEIAAALADDIARFRKVTGQAFDEWSV